MKLFITISTLLLSNWVNSNYLLAQSFFADPVSVKQENVPSDNFINEKGEVINKTYRCESIVIDAELLVRNYFDEENRLVVKRYYNHSSELYYDDYGVAIYEYKYDDAGNRISVSHYDEFKRPFQINFIGPAFINFEYDNEKRVVKVSFFDIEHQLTSATGTAIREYVYNDQNQIVEERCFDEESNPLDFMAPVIRYKYNGQGKVVEKTFFDIKGIPTYRLMDEEDESDFSKIVFDYSGNKPRAKFYRLNGQEIMPY